MSDNDGTRYPPSRPSLFSRSKPSEAADGIRTTMTRRKVYTIAGITIGVVVATALVLGLVLGLKKNNSSNNSSPPLTVALIGLDGFRPDYITQAGTPNIWAFFQSGVNSSDGLEPPFPAQSFPSQYAMVTGLNPAFNGIVGDYFHADELDAVNPSSFNRNGSGVETQGSWLGTPLWVTLRKAGYVVATAGWPSTEANVGGLAPQLDLAFNKSQTDTFRVDTLLKWCEGKNVDGSSTGTGTPYMIAMHFRILDVNGTANGPGLKASALTAADNTFAHFMKGLQDLGLDTTTNVIVVSDHGMASTPLTAGGTPANIVYYEDLFNVTATPSPIKWLVHNRPMAYIYLNPGVNAADFTAKWLSIPNMTYYLKSGDSHAYPDEFLNPSSNRIPDIMIVPDEGYVLGYRNTAGVPFPKVSKGSAGYLNTRPSMRGVFAAKGPLFAKGTSIQGPVRSADVYNVLARALGVQAEPGNGRLPNGLFV
ncbi:hypothetical protein HK101_011972 [Irineochytrium annulatum]|nr:hypothetical protein HK101_011972 [Irineochytrium annulatum]